VAIVIKPEEVSTRTGCAVVQFFASLADHATITDCFIALIVTCFWHTSIKGIFLSVVTRVACNTAAVVVASVAVVGAL